MPFDELRANGRLQVSQWFDKLSLTRNHLPFVVSLSVPFVVSLSVPFVVSLSVPFVVSLSVPFVVSLSVPFVVSLSNHAQSIKMQRLNK